MKIAFNSRKESKVKRARTPFASPSVIVAAASSNRLRAPLGGEGGGAPEEEAKSHHHQNTIWRWEPPSAREGHRPADADGLPPSRNCALWRNARARAKTAPHKQTGPRRATVVRCASRQLSEGRTQKEGEGAKL
ncbi:hypothetical protein AAVH_24488 [Aphelenchoides avenae]|nr:hypothetical protein AAVH_24488 [Aphelenchus avenae]